MSTRSLRQSGAYYNEWDADTAAWLRELIRRGHLPTGDVDERSITDVSPDDLRGYRQCHFFAGIGGWPFALALAGLPDDAQVWTGSPPCQPFSAAGKRDGRDDKRHLAPVFGNLVSACRPRLLFGEQVASSEVVGPSATGPRRRAGTLPEWAWLDDLSDRLEGSGYATCAADIPAAGVGAPHIRQRLFFGAVRVDDRASPRPVTEGTWPEGEARDETRLRGSEPRRPNGGVAHSDGERRTGRGARGEWEGHTRAAGHGAPFGMAHSDADRAREQSRELPSHEGEHGLGRAHGHHPPEHRSAADRLANLGGEGLEERRGDPGPPRGTPTDGRRAVGWLADGDGRGSQARREGRARARHGDPTHADGGDGGVAHHTGRSRPGASHEGWEDADWLFCRDGRWRPVRPGSFPLAHGVPARVVRLRGYGNAICPQAAGAFVGAFLRAVGSVRG